MPNCAAIISNRLLCELLCSIAGFLFPLATDKVVRPRGAIRVPYTKKKKLAQNPGARTSAAGSKENCRCGFAPSLLCYRKISFCFASTQRHAWSICHCSRDSEGNLEVRPEVRLAVGEKDRSWSSRGSLRRGSAAGNRRDALGFPSHPQGLREAKSC